MSLDGRARGPRVLIACAAGFTNLGDDAIVSAMVAELRDAIPEATFAVSRYRTDGWALATETPCDGEPWRLVLGRLDTGWQEIDEIQQDPYFGCSVLGTYSVPVFVAGTTCLDGAQQPQEYTG